MRENSKSQIKTAIIVISISINVILGYISYTLFFAITHDISHWMLPPQEPLIIGFSRNPDTIDPVDCWDVPSANVIHQVCEGLVQYNLSSNSNYEIIPCLAKSWKWHGTNFDEISFELRQDVLFHDNNTFDADDVIWNFDRLTWFCNYSGTLLDNTTSWLASPASLYYFSDGTPIISNYYINSEYSVTFELSRSFTPFLDLLTYVAGFIVSPDSTTRWTYLDLMKEVLVGTGPFKYIGYMYDVEIRFERFGYYNGAYYAYWGDLPWAYDLIFDVTVDDYFRNMDMLSFRIDYLQGVLPEILDTFNESAQHVVYPFEEGLCYYYLEFYCGSAGHAGLNVTWRKALQYAVNYTYIIDEIYYGAVVRGPPAIPRLMPGHNASVQIIDADITKARQLVMSMFPVETTGLDPTYPGTTEAGWLALNLRKVQINRLSGSITNQKMNQNMNKTFSLFGVEINETIRTEQEYLDTGENSPWDMEISFSGLCCDYLDAFSILNLFFDNQSRLNFAHVDDPYLQSLFDQASQQPDALLRQQINMHIQSYLFEERTPMHVWKYPHAPLFSIPYFIVHAKYLQGVSYNPLKILDCWNWYV